MDVSSPSLLLPLLNFEFIMFRFSLMTNVIVIHAEHFVFPGLSFNRVSSICTTTGLSTVTSKGTTSCWRARGGSNWLTLVIWKWQLNHIMDRWKETNLSTPEYCLSDLPFSLRCIVILSFCVGLICGKCQQHGTKRLKCFTHSSPSLSTTSLYEFGRHPEHNSLHLQTSTSIPGWTDLNLVTKWKGYSDLKAGSWS